MSIAAFSHSLAVVIGINRYANGISQLKTATNDAHVLAQQLKREHGYDVDLLVDEAATKEAILHLFKEISRTITENDRLLFYFAGHGLAMDGDDGPAGYLIPQDARLGQNESFLPMQVLHKALTDLPCRHSLIILDCCFAGAFRWSSTRDVSTHPEIIYKERFDRFIQDPAWQVITSTAYDQFAHDVSQGSLKDNRGQGSSNHHSPFAEALFDALGGAADCFPIVSDGEPNGDGVITATELYLYLRDHVELQFDIEHQRQTPGLWPLKKHDKGEYIFLVPGHELNLPPAPELSTANNPYRGLASFNEEQAHLFFGRDQLIADLQAFVWEHPLTVVLGPSGTGKSSLVKAGLIPALRESDEMDWQILPPVRPGDSPLRALARAILSLSPDQITDTETIDALAEELAQDPKALTRKVLVWGKRHPHKHLLLVIDQFEELVTQCHHEQERQQFLELLKKAIRLAKDRGRIVLTLRSDFEPQFVQSSLKEIWMQSRFLVKPMTQDELRQAIEAPAAERVMVFEPHNLVEQLINEVVQMPGALPLLSFTLSELYLRYLQRQDGNRAMTQADYEALGGVAGSLTQRATQEYEILKQQDPAYEHTMKRVMLRMVAIEGGELARRRVPRSELVYSSEAENARIEEVIQRLTAVRLVVEGQEPGGEPYVEPAHDALVQGWSQLLRWKNEAQNNLFLQRQVSPAAKAWSERKGTLWNADPRLALFKPMLRLEQTWLNGRETEFIRRSLRTKHKNQLIRLSSVAAFVFAVGSLGVLANAERLKADQNALNFRFEAAQSLINAWRAIINQTDAGSQTLIAKHNAEIANQNEKRANKQAKIAQDNAEEADEQRQRAVEGEAEANRQTENARKQTQIANEQRSIAELRALDNEIRAQTLEMNNLLDSNSHLEMLLRGLEMAVNIQQQEFKVPQYMKMRAASALLQAVYGIRVKTQFEAVADVHFSPKGLVLVNVSFDGAVHLKWSDSPHSVSFRGHNDLVGRVYFSPDGQTIVTTSLDGTVRLWQLDGTLIKILEENTRPHYPVEFSPDGQTIATVDSNGLVRLWGLDGILVKTLNADIGPSGQSVSISGLDFSPDGQTIAIASSNGKVQLLRVDGTLLKSLEGHTGQAFDIEFSPDGQTIAIAGSDGKVQLLRVDGTLLKSLEGHTGRVFDIEFSPDGQTIASGGEDRTVRLWQNDDVPNNKTPIGVFRGHTDLVYKVGFSPDSQTIFSSSEDNTVLFWQQDGVPVNSFEGQDFVFSPDSQMIASSTGDSIVHLMRRDTSSINNIEGYGSSSIHFSPDSQNIISVNKEGVVRWWEKDGTLIAPLGNIESTGQSYFSPDGQIVASLGEDNTVQLWQQNGRLLATLKGHSKAIRKVRFSPDGQIIATASEDGTARLWKLDGTSIATLEDHFVDSPFNDVVFSPDGQTVATASYDNTARLWKLDGTLIKILKGHTKLVYAIRFSPDGQSIATVGYDNTARLWELDGTPIAILEGHTAPVMDVAFSPDGQIIATAGQDTIVRLWQQDGTPIAILEGHNYYVSRVSFSPDSQIIASTSANGKGLLWNFNLDDLIESGCDWLQDYMAQPTTPAEEKALCQKPIQTPT